MHAPERAAAVGFGGSAPAGADRIDNHKIGERAPGTRGVHQTAAGAVIAMPERRDARSDQAEIEERRAGAGSAVEHESYRARRIVRFRHEGRIEDGGRALAGLIEQRERAGRRRIGKLARRRIDGVLGNGIARQKRKHAGAVLARDIWVWDAPFLASLLASARSFAGRPLAM